ncbi:thioredoxin-like protein [Mucor mucedo]|uniref:thioredoxin-like protein n=1 Tax=Mucor mucedo TaxID=29922 RepID=UPI002220C6DD|nr:thioredoxin-like protein [Mucor mucedo]KAI7893935.1 thioredoxin-like protein [Mucor mucedo]
MDESIRILAQNNWNLEAAVQNRYTPTDRHATTIYEEEDADSPSSSSALLGHTPNRPTNHHRISSFFMWPFNLAWKFSWRLFQLTARLLYRPSITAPRRDARSEADRFLRDFESTYGTTHPDFFEGGYTQALNVAKRDLVFLLVFLSSEEHDDHDAFCRTTLTNPQLIDFLRQHHILLWGGNVRYTEAFQVSNTLQATTYPFLAIIALHTSSGTTTQKMAVLDRLEGPVTPAAVIRRLETAMARTDLSQLRRERDQRETERRLREEQDHAYQASLLADREKERKLKWERERERLAELERQRQAQAKQQYIRYLCQKLKNHHEEEEGKMAKISFRLANGERVIHKFKGSDSLESLYEFIEAYPYLKENGVVQEEEEPPENYTHRFGFTIHSSFPKTVYPPDPNTKIEDQKGLWPSATLIVDITDEEDEEEEE